MSFRRGRGMGNGRFDGGRGRDGDGGRGGRGGGRDSRDGRDSGPRALSNHTSDAAMASARIFIGNLPTNDARLTKELLEETFNKYGHILGISILKGFGFIQYADEVSVEKAIRGAQNTEILGHRMDVKNARSGKDGMNAGGGNSDGNFRDRSPIRRREFDMGNRGREPDMPMRGREPDMMMRGREPERERGPRDFDGRDREWGNRERNLDHYPVEPFMEHERERHPRDSFHQMPSDNLGGNFGSNMMPKQGPPSANEVEIIVTSKSGPVRQFAERIEARVKSLGFAVDVLFPHEEIPIRKVLTDLSNRGTLYGIILTPLNQEHGSITLNILFGQPEEHRNMPIEEAFALLSSSFKHRQGMDSGNSDRRMQAAAGVDAHPPNVQLLINLLQENRPLSVPEYDRLIRYLNERRDRQSRLEMNDDPNRAASNMANNQHQAMAYIQGGGGLNPHPHGFVPSAAPGLAGQGGQQQDSQSELQQRILSILNSGSAAGVASVQAPGGVLGVPAPVPVPAPHHTGPSGAGPWSGPEVTSTGQPAHGPLIGDASAAHKALDGLIQTAPNMMNMKHFPNNRNMSGSPSHRPSMQPQGNYYPNMSKRF